MYDAFTARQLRDAITVLVHCQRRSMELHDILESLETEVQKRESGVPVITGRKQVDNKVCPSCGHILQPVVTRDAAVRIRGCKKCRYSEVI